MKTLMPHQEQALQWALKRARVALFMEMRLGKSLVIIRWAKAYAIRDVLIVAPGSAIPGWKEELIDDGIKKIDIIELEGDTQERVDTVNAIMKRKNKRQKWFLTNYEGIANNLNFLKIHWPGMILDESTRIRNPQSNISDALVKYTAFVGYKAILTGCPRPESELDYVQQILFIQDSFMSRQTYWQWRKCYCRQEGYNWKFDPYFQRRLEEELKGSAFSLSRKEAGMGEKKVYEKRYVKLNTEQKTLYSQVEKEFEVTLKDKKSILTKWAPVKFNWMQEIAGGFYPGKGNGLLSNAKNDEILSLLKTELKNEKVVIWFKYNHELDNTIEFLKKFRIKCAKFTGEDKKGEEEFKNGSIEVMCAQPKAAMQALDWSNASTAIYYSNWPDGEIRIQSEDRIVSVRKKEPLLYIDLITEDTIDEDIRELVVSKKLNSEKIMQTLQKRMVKKYENND